MIILYLFVIVIFLCLLHIVLNCNEKARLLRKIPGFKDRFIFGNAFEVLYSPVELMKFGRECAKKWNGIYRFWSFPIAAVHIYNPEDIETILSNAKFNQKSVVYNLLRPWLGNGLLVSNGDHWVQRRKILTPAFHFNILRQFCVVFQENSQQLVQILYENSGKAINIVPILSEFTLNSICETAMGTQLNKTRNSGQRYKLAIYKLGEIIIYRFLRTYLLIDWIFKLTILSWKQKQFLRVVHKFTSKVIADRKDYIQMHGTANVDDDEEEIYVYKKAKKTAMLDLLISAHKEGLIDDAGIQEEVDTFMFEGHDTTSSGLTFCFMNLANHKPIQAKVYAELMNIFGDSNRPATVEDLSKMHYLECCIKESLRLYPPVHFISRHLLHDVTLSNYTVPSGTICNILIIDLHRREDLFPNPLKFDPDRFTAANSAGRHPYAYIPFSAGPRNCIGQKFAILEMKSAIAEVLRHFELVPVTTPADIEFTADLVLRNSGPVCVNFVKRNI